MSADVTTIKVTKPLRDRINDAAGRGHQTVQGFLEAVMDDYDRQQRLAAMAAAMNSADAAAMDEYRDETAAWEALDRDLEEQA